MKTKLTNLINSIILVVFLSGCEVPQNGKKESYRENGTLEQIDVLENGVLSKVESYREDGTLEQIDVYENGTYKNSKVLMDVEY